MGRRPSASRHAPQPRPWRSFRSIGDTYEAPTARREAAERRGALTAAAPSLRFPPARRLPGVECGLLAQEPAPGKPSSASGASIGGTVCITRLSDAPPRTAQGRSRRRTLCRRPLQRGSLGCVARVHRRRRAPRRPALLRATGASETTYAHDRGARSGCHPPSSSDSRDAASSLRQDTVTEP